MSETMIMGLIVLPIDDIANYAKIKVSERFKYKQWMSWIQRFILNTMSLTAGRREMKGGGEDDDSTRHFNRLFLVIVPFPSVHSHYFMLIGFRISSLVAIIVGCIDIINPTVECWLMAYFDSYAHMYVRFMSWALYRTGNLS